MHWLTSLGEYCQSQSKNSAGLPRFNHDFPDIDWRTYGEICFIYREAVLTALSHPMKSSDIRRKAVEHNPELRIGSTHVRQVLREFRKRRLVEVSKERKKPPTYKLTFVGEQYRKLLTNVTTVFEK